LNTPIPKPLVVLPDSLIALNKFTLSGFSTNTSLEFKDAFPVGLPPTRLE